MTLDKPTEIRYLMCSSQSGDILVASVLCMNGGLGGLKIQVFIWRLHRTSGILESEDSGSYGHNLLNMVSRG